MSNFRAIATVTATVQRTLQEAVQADVAGATVSTVRPAEGEGTNLPTVGVNIFLYQVGPNPSWRNADLPTRRNDGELAQRPQAALDLHYLFSFYGGDPLLEPQRLLGSTVAFLHAQPLLTRAQVEAAVADVTKPFLASSDLADQIDLVRFVPLSLSLEELSRLWSIFFQVRYVLSVAYQASVVLVEPQLTPRPALPAREFTLAALPIRRLAVTAIVAATGADDPIVPGSTVLVEGDDLRAEVMRVEIDGAEVPVLQSLPMRITLALPAGLAAGAHSLRVRHGVELGAAGVPHLVFSSNVASFVLHPVITETGGVPDIAIDNVQGGGSDPRSADLTVGVGPAVRPAQLTTLELLTAEGVAHTFLARPRADEADPVEFGISGVAAGDYLFRVRVDGAESPVGLDPAGVPVSPEATIP